MKKKIQTSCCNRVRNWDYHVTQYLESVVGQPFVYGETDCATIVCRFLEAMYGRRITPKLRYKTAVGAAKALKKHGIARALMKLGAYKVSRPRRYDLLIVDNVGGFSEGVSIMLPHNMRLMTNTQTGVVRVPFDYASAPDLVLRLPE